MRRPRIDTEATLPSDSLNVFLVENLELKSKLGKPIPLAIEGASTADN